MTKSMKIRNNQPRSKGNGRFGEVATSEQVQRLADELAKLQDLSQITHNQLIAMAKQYTGVKHNLTANKYLSLAFRLMVQRGQ